MSSCASHADTSRRHAFVIIAYWQESVRATRAILSEIGDRVFDIVVEGQTFSDYDIVEDVGRHQAVVKTFVATVGADGVLNVDLNGSVEAGVNFGPLLSAIEVLTI